MDNTISRMSAQNILTYNAVDTPSDTTVVKNLALSLYLYSDSIFVIHNFGSAMQSFWSSCGISYIDGIPEYATEGPVCTIGAFESWTHVALALNSTEGNLKIYLNGTKVMDVLHDAVTAGPQHNLADLEIPTPQEAGIVTFGQNPGTYQVATSNLNQHSSCDE
eukprot:scaffold21608_cov28-Prasinocladus_malaysianus.AAC.1